MSFSGNFMCTSFKVQLLEGVHDFRPAEGDVFKIALYDNNASFTAATTAYTTVNEIASSGSYVAGGGILTKVSPTSSGTTALTSFLDISFTSATITDGAVYGQRLMFTRTFILPEYVQDEVDFVPILPVESLAFPYGILITKFGIKTDANTTYSVVLEDWSDPQTHSADISTVATSASDEAASAALTTTVAAGNIVGVDLPTTTGVKSLQVWFEYEIKAS